MRPASFDALTGENLTPRSRLCRQTFRLSETNADQYQRRLALGPHGRSALSDLWASVSDWKLTDVPCNGRSRHSVRPARSDIQKRGLAAVSNRRALNRPNEIFSVDVIYGRQHHRRKTPTGFTIGTTIRFSPYRTARPRRVSVAAIL